jgi:hypothetical protein
MSGFGRFDYEFGGGDVGDSLLSDLVGTGDKYVTPLTVPEIPDLLLNVD